MNDCILCGFGPDGGPPIAAVTSPEGPVYTLCAWHLDYWLDNADIDPALEPSELRWLVPA